MRSRVVLLGAFALVNACNCQENLGGLAGGLIGQVCDEDTGLPLVGAAVSVDGPVHKKTLVDGTGGYTVNGLPAGDYTITATLGAVKRDFTQKISSGDTAQLTDAA